MSKFIKKTLLTLLLILSYLNKVVPKFKVILFFTNKSNFNDNNIAFLNWLVMKKLNNDYLIILCTKDGMRNSFRYPEVKLAPHWLGPFLFLISRFCFYDAGTLKIRPSKKQKVISLWHGVPLKKIGALVETKISSLDKYNDFTKILLPSLNLSEIYKQSFECEEEQLMENGFPRNDYLFKKDKRVYEILFENLEAKKVIMWMPTFRSSLDGRYKVDSDKSWDLPIFNSYAEIVDLNEYLVGHGAFLIIKIHPNSTLNIDTRLQSLSNIFVISNDCLNKNMILNYEVLAWADALITDYSSVFFDYLLVNRPIAFTVDDVDGYAQARGFNFDNLEKVMAGDKVLDKKGFYNFVENVLAGKDDFLEQRNELLNYIHSCKDGNASGRLAGDLGL